MPTKTLMKYNERPSEIDIIVAIYKVKYKTNGICVEFFILHHYHNKPATNT